MVQIANVLQWLKNQQDQCYSGISMLISLAVTMLVRLSSMAVYHSAKGGAGGVGGRERKAGCVQNYTRLWGATAKHVIL